MVQRSAAPVPRSRGPRIVSTSRPVVMARVGIHTGCWFVRRYCAASVALNAVLVIVVVQPSAAGPVKPVVGS